MNKGIAETLRRELNPATFVPAATWGVVAGVLEVVYAISFCALIYANTLPGSLGNGLVLALVGTAISMTVTALFATLRGQASGIQETPAVITALMVAAMVKSLPPGTSSEVAYASVIALIAGTALLSGLVFLFLGTFRLGALIRFLPYPVVGGFLAGSGWLLVAGAIELLSGQAPSVVALGSLAQPDVLAHWIPALALAVLMVVVLQRTDHYLALPAMLVASSLAFYAVAFASGYRMDDLLAGHWLFGAAAGQGVWQPVAVTALAGANVRAAFAQLPGVVTIAALSTLQLLLNCTGLEVELKRPISLNRELRVAGAANIIAGLLSASLVGFHDMSITSLVHRSGARTRLVGLTTAAVCVAAAVFGSSFLVLFPKVVAGALLAMLGLGFLKTWLWDSARRLPRVEYAIVLTIAVVIATFGLVEGVAVGLTAAIALFIVAYSRTDVVRTELTRSDVHSHVVRSLVQARLLHQRGVEIYVLRLQGFIFFGTAERLLNHVRGRLDRADVPAAKSIVFDFRRVIGMDSTGVASFIKMAHVLAERQAAMIIADAPPGVERQLSRGGLTGGHDVRFARDLDQALEWCEDDVLRAAAMLTVDAPASISQQLSALGLPASDIGELLPFLTREETAPGTYLMHQGDAPDSMFIIESGQLTVQLESPGRPPLRLETFGSGRVVGEIGYFLGGQRTASVVVDAPSVVYRLNAADAGQLAREHPMAFAALNRLTIQSLSDRLTHLNRTVDALQR